MFAATRVWLRGGHLGGALRGHCGGTRGALGGHYGGTGGALQGH